MLTRQRPIAAAGSVRRNLLAAIQAKASGDMATTRTRRTDPPAPQYWVITYRVTHWADSINHVFRASDRRTAYRYARRVAAVRGWIILGLARDDT